MSIVTKQERQDRRGSTPTHRDERRGGDDVPPLNSGDRLTRAEFERRYAARPDIKKTDII